TVRSPGLLVLNSAEHPLLLVLPSFGTLRDPTSHCTRQTDRRAFERVRSTRHGMDTRDGHCAHDSASLRVVRDASGKTSDRTLMRRTPSPFWSRYFSAASSMTAPIFRI